MSEIDSMTMSAPTPELRMASTQRPERPFYLIPLLIALAYFLATPLPAKSS
jgi:hypothetical protein